MVNGINTVSLTRPIELKLVSGPTAPGRQKDLADLQERIRAKGLDESLAADLDPLVRDKYRILVAGVEHARNQDSERR